MTLDERQQHLLDNGLARTYRGQLIPIIRGGDETDEEKAAREKREADEAAAAAKDKTFSQADVDRIVQERLARDRKDRPSDDEIAELREKAKKYDDVEAANATELEKVQKRAEQAERERDEAKNAAKETRLTAAILAEASKADRKVVDPQAVLKLLDRDALELADDGNPKNIAEAMDKLLEASPYLVSTGGANNGRRDAADQGARGGNGGVEQLTSTDGMNAEEIAKALSEGRLDTYLTTSNK